MKKSIILAITFLCVFAQTSFGQQPYRSLKECGNDTAKYLRDKLRKEAMNPSIKAKH